MIRLLQIEWLKVKANTSFWILLIIYGVSVYAACSMGTVLLNATINTYSTDGSVEVPVFNIYKFPDIWHNLTYIASYLRVFLGIVVILSVANERTYRTLRQNIIDGLSPLEFLSTKFFKITLLSILATLLVLGLTYYMGIQYSESYSWEYANQKMEFIGGFFLQTLTFLSFALFIGVLFKSLGLSLVFVIAYSFFLEGMLRWMFFDPEGLIVQLFPINAMNNLIQAPFSIFDPENVQTTVQTDHILIALGWVVVFFGGSYLLLSKKDL